MKFAVLRLRAFIHTCLTFVYVRLVVETSIGFPQISYRTGNSNENTLPDGFLSEYGRWHTNIGSELHKVRSQWRDEALFLNFVSPMLTLRLPNHFIDQRNFSESRPQNYTRVL